MDKAKLFCGGMILLISCSGAVAGLTSVFAGFDWVQENKVSGLESSFAPTTTPPYLPASMFTLGPERVSYPSPVGQVPSPGGETGAKFDEAGLGVKVQGSNLVVRAAGAVNPLTGRLYSGVVYGQGDVFVTVDDSAGGVKNFALLNSWPSDSSGYLELNGGHFTWAQEFHTGGTSGPSLEGHLVSLSADADVVLIGGTRAYDPGDVEGLDPRAYAQGGSDLGPAGLVHTEIPIALSEISVPIVTDILDTWYIQTWTFPTNWLSSDPVFTMGLHKIASCGNDQIGMVTVVPIPPAVLLGMLGLSIAGVKLRRFA